MATLTIRNVPDATQRAPRRLGRGLIVLDASALVAARMRTTDKRWGELELGLKVRVLR